MNRTALLFGVGASLILAAGTASAAGSCGAEVAELQQKLGTDESANATIGATDPGVQQPSPSASADTSTSTTTTTNDQVAAGTANQDNSANATIGATDPGVQQPAPEANASADTSTTTGTGTSTTTTTDGSSATTADNSGANATIGATDPGVQQPQNTDPVADSNSSSTTTTDSSTTTADSSTTTMPSSGTVEETSRVGDMNTSAGGRVEAITALKKAQMAADAGDESTCTTELGNAKTALGIQ